MESTQLKLMRIDALQRSDFKELRRLEKVAQFNNVTLNANSERLVNKLKR